MVDILKQYSLGSQERETIHFHPFVRLDECTDALQYAATTCTDDEQSVTCFRCNSVLVDGDWRMLASVQPGSTYTLAFTGYEVIRSKREVYLQLYDGERADLWRMDIKKLSFIRDRIKRTLAEWEPTESEKEIFLIDG